MPRAGAQTRRADQRFSDTVAWPEMRSEYTWLPPHDDITVTRPNQIGVSFSHHRSAVIESANRTTEVDIPGGTVVVTGHEPLVWTRVREPTDALEIYLDPAAFPPAVFPETGPTIALARDAVVLGAASMLKRAHLGQAWLSDMAASTLTHRIAWQVATRYGTSPAAPFPRPPGLLDRRALDRIAELINAELGETLTLSRLAAEASLSPYHFARAFKASTGLAPHQFVTMQRLERARNLITSSPVSVAEVAYSVGFSNLSHFRRLFRRHTGWSPGDLRRPRSTLRDRRDHLP